MNELALFPVTFGRLSNTQAENTLSETQKRLINRIGDLQRVQKKNEELSERNGKCFNSYMALDRGDT